MVAWTLDSLQRVAGLSATLVVLAPDDSQFESQVPDFAGPKAWVARCGGATRAASVSNGLAHLLGRGATAQDWVLVHDAARCLVRPEWVERLIAECSSDAVGGLLALPLADTLKDGAGARVQRTIDRSDKWAAQTPQMFRIGALQHALAAAGPLVTDEASAIEASGGSPKLVRGDIENLKLTWPEDFALAQRLLASRRREDSGDDESKALFPPRDAEPSRPMHRDQTMNESSLRIGEGWDVHALVSGRKLVLGGVTVPHSHGLDGHSDADALAHAITDALLGAAALGDIGRHFPDSDPAFDGADSMNLLAETARRVRAAGFEVVNVDSTIVAQVPKLAPHIPAMRARLADTLGLGVGAVNVKAKTAEQMGPVGEGRAIEARAVCLLARR